MRVTRAGGRLKEVPRTSKKKNRFSDCPVKPGLGLAVGRNREHQSLPCQGRTSTDPSFCLTLLIEGARAAEFVTRLHTFQNVSKRRQDTE